MNGRRDADSSEQWRYIGRKRQVLFSWVAAMKCDLRLQRSPFILDFWGKASPTNQAGISTHSIVYHSLDVAAVGTELIWRDRGRLTRIAAAIGVEVATLRSALPFPLALHDIGKYARVFQAKSPD